MANKKISQLDVRTSPTLADLLAIADPSTGYAYKITGTSLATTLGIDGKVPYTGATASLNLGAYNLTATNIIRSGGLATEFLKADGSVDSTTYMNRAIYDSDGDGVVDSASKMQTIGRNSTGATLYKGTIVYISGSTGNRPNFVKAQANSEATSAGTFGVVVADIANNADGYVATIGTLSDLDTRTTATNPFTSVTLSDGDTLYLDPSTAGYVTNVKPSAPNHLVYVGKVTRTSPTLGTIVYRIQNGYEISEIHDISITSPTNNDVLVYESATTLWKNKSIATILGYTPANDSLVMHLAGSETATGYKTFSIGLQTNTGDNYLNYSSGATYVGYSAAPASPLKFNVNGGINVEFSGTRFLTFSQRPGYADVAEISTLNTTYLRIIPNGYLWLLPQDASSTIILGTNITKQTLTASTLYGSSSVAGYGFNGGTNAAQVWKANIDAGGGIIGNFIFHGSDYGTFVHRITGSTTALQTIKTTGQIQLHNYTSTSVFTGTLAGLLGFDSSGNVITSAAGISGSGTSGQVTYWNGTSSVTGNSNFNFNTTNNGSLLIGTTTNPGSNGSGLVIYSSMYPRITLRNSTTTDGIDFGFHMYMNGKNIFYDTEGNTSYHAWVTNGNEKLRLFANGNLFIQSGGTFTDSGYRLDINGTGASTGALRVTGGTSLIQGGGNTSGTIALSLQNSDASNLLRVRNDGILFFGNLSTSTACPYIAPIDGQTTSTNVNGSSLYFNLLNNNNSNLGPSGFWFNSSFSPGTGGQSKIINITGTFTGAGNSENIAIRIANTINSTSTAATRGLYINPTITAAADWRSLEWSNNSGYGIYGAGTASNYVAGNFGFQQTSPTAIVDIGASTTSKASLRIRSGTAPTTPNDGDIWFDGTDLKIRVAGSTKTFTIV